MDSVNVPNGALMPAVHAVRVTVTEKLTNAALAQRTGTAFASCAVACSQTAPKAFERVVLHSHSDVLESEEAGVRRRTERARRTVAERRSCQARVGRVV